MYKSDKGNTLIGGKRFVWGARTYVMGVINVTPDSFSGDGIADDVGVAVEQGKNFEKWGADIIDIGGESTRPPALYAGSSPVSLEEEVSRVVPVIQAMVRAVKIPVSIDTYKSGVARNAISAGASMINDVWGLSRDPEIAQVASEADVPVVLMHNQHGTHYSNLVQDMIGKLKHLCSLAVQAGIKESNILLDPGIGFGKTGEQNLEIIRRIGEFECLMRPILVGTSRKSTIGDVLNLPVHDRLEGTAATVALSIAGGADIVRVHDVKEMVRVVRMSDSIVRGWSPIN